MKLHYLHIIVPQGEEANPKKENLFEQLLINLHKMAHHHHATISLEYFGFEQYTYCYVVTDEEWVETIEGLIYSTFPDAEIRPTKDYTAGFSHERFSVAGATLGFRFRDVYPIK